MPDPESHLTDGDYADLAALVDGLLPPDRAESLQARIDADPLLVAELARQRAAVRMVTAAAAEVEAPMGLRERIEAQRTAAPAKRRSWTRWLMPAAAGGALAAVIVALVVMLGGGAPSVSDTLSAATEPAAIGVSVDSATPQLLSIERGGVPFPNFAAKFGWKATGARTDEINGRATTTVFYVRGDQKVAYTIVDGEPLEHPEGEEKTIDGKTFTVSEDGNRTVVTWERGGHTCVLSGVNVSSEDLLELAGWKGKGKVPF
ncbi:MAG: hypothetical protein JHC95_23165 [Solirubrobacteraceae bacterium]|nr:hypothetical protein [Solirubrobacteraceae bacterium]